MKAMRTWLGMLLVAGCYAPSFPTGAPCGTNDACPSALVCVSTTHTCERPSGALADGPTMDVSARGDGGADAPGDGPTGPPMATFLGHGQASAEGATAALVLSTSVPIAAFLVAEIAARGALPISVADSRGNTWRKAVEIDNASTTEVAGVYYCSVSVAMGVGDTITATVTTASSNTRAIAVFQLTNITALDQIGSARTSGTAPSVTTTGAVTASNELLFAVIATGHNAAETFVPGVGFTEVYEFGSGLSSGSFNQRNGASLSGPQTFTATTTAASASHATVIATFR